MFSTYFQKSKELRLLRRKSPDYATSCEFDKDVTYLWYLRSKKTKKNQMNNFADSNAF